MLGKNWLTSNEVQAWALQYLQRRGLKYPDQEPAQTLYNKLTQVNTLKENTPENREILRKLKGAWSQRKHRNDKKRKKNSNYVLTTEAARKLDRLADDFRMTKLATLERIISDRLDQENVYTSEKKDDGVYKKRAAIFERHLDQALEELCRYKLLLEETASDLRLDKAKYDKIDGLVRGKKAEAIKELPPLPNRKDKKSKKPAKPLTKRETTPSAKVTSTTEQPTKKQSKVTAETQAAGEKPTTAAAEAQPEQADIITPTTAMAGTAQQLQETLAADKDAMTTTPAITQASSAHLDEHHENDSQHQSQPNASSETNVVPVSAKKTNPGEPITAQNPPKPPVTEQIDENAITDAGAPPHPMHDEPAACERPDEVENQPEFTEEKMAELKRFFHDSES